MLTNKKLKIPDWLEENDLLAMLLAHATTKYEYFASKARLFSNKYGTDYHNFKQKIEGSGRDESFAGTIHHTIQIYRPSRITATRAAGFIHALAS